MPVAITPEMIQSRAEAKHREEIRRVYAVATEWLTLAEVADELHMDYKRVRAWATREDDPLPVRLIDGNKKQGRVFRPQLNEWLMRNSKEVNHED